MPSNYGIQQERNLVHWLTLDEMGYKAMRAGASGGGTDGDRADVICGCAERCVQAGIEIKTASGDNTYYIGKGDIRQIEDFCADFGLDAYFAFKRKRHDFFFMTIPEVRDLHETEQSFRMKKEEEPDNKRRFYDLFGEKWEIEEE